ncbi:MAG: BON domain-containing protein [Anaerolineae bacterium]|nr:BON domain-containing protein [Gemmatimonadaceae bacterium]
MRLPWIRKRRPLAERACIALERAGIRIGELTVTDAKGRVTLHGAVPSHVVRENILQLVLAVDGVKALDDRLTVAAAADPVISSISVRPAKEVYVTQPGDTLPIIAERHFGDRRRWEELLAMNSLTVSDPMVLQPGLRLHVPPT